MDEFFRWLIGLGFCAAVIGGPLWVFDWLPPHGVSKVYVKACSDSKKCSGRDAEYVSYQFRAEFENQLVIRKSMGSLSTLHLCEVLNGDNWTCAGEKMVDGEYVDTSLFGSLIKPVSKVRWHVERLLAD